MRTATIAIQATIGGRTINGSLERTANGGKSHVIPLPAGTAGTLTTRTDDNTGIATLASGHGLQTGEKVAVFWSGGSRGYMDVTVAGDAITIDGGDGDVLPDQDTVVVVTKMVQVTSDFDGDDMQAIVAKCQQRAFLGFFVASSLSYSLQLDAGQLWAWAADTGLANPLTGGPVHDIFVANGSNETAATLELSTVIDITP